MLPVPLRLTPREPIDGVAVAPLATAPLLFEKMSAEGVFQSTSREELTAVDAFDAPPLVTVTLSV